MADDQRPIIIKKVKKGGGHGHHGGAWKVAYADFVTAMMAFFLMLWLLSSAEQEQLEGLAEYFTPTIGIKDSEGIGLQGGTANIEDGSQSNELSAPGVVIGAVPQGPIPDMPEKTAQKEGQEDSYLFEQATEAVKQAIETDANLRDLSDNIMVEQTPEGLKIEIMDSDEKPMFDGGRSSVTQFGRRILKGMLGIIEKMPNFISITGHTDSSPLGRNKDYTNWELSADRANAARRYLLSEGLDAERTKKVQGMADTELLIEENPSDPKNRRITIILLRGSHMNVRDEQLPAARGLLSVPGVGPSRMGQKEAVVPEPVEEPAVEKSPEVKIAPDTQTMGIENSPIPEPLEQLRTDEPVGDVSGTDGQSVVNPDEKRKISTSPMLELEKPEPAELTDEDLEEFLQ